MLELYYLFLTYLLASVPTGYLLAALYADVDLRTQGSGNIGATNAGRVVGTGVALVTLAGDAFKGWLPVMLASWLNPSGWFLGAVAVTAFLGHCYSGYLEFRGGKGVATVAGVMLALAPGATLLAALIWAGVVAGTRRSSLGALVAAGLLPLLVWWLSTEWLLLTLILAAGVVSRHRENIERLMAGSERGLGA